ncbi:unnamed protein product [Phytophthora lilii]|uniref:Unnamed protein product n=1 Tax=Phytophthora lilii TaxID=2077276 RepID=A0A9W7CNG2_9STRA|nr:unnamed protein product [Phytophthora lilii]
MSIRDLTMELRDPIRPFKCPIDKITLYLAKQNGRWLRIDKRDVSLLMRGELPDSMRAVMNESNKLDPQCRVSCFPFRDARDPRWKDEIHVIMDPPEYIKRRYRAQREADRHTLQKRSPRERVARSKKVTPGVIYLARKAPSHGEANETNVEAQGDSNSLFPIGDQATSMWLMSRDHDVNAFMRGGNHELKDDRNRLMPRRAIANYLLPTTVDGAFHVLVFDVPEYVKEDLRAAAGKENLYDEIKNAEGLYVHQFSCLQKTFVVVNTNFLGAVLLQAGRLSFWRSFWDLYCTCRVPTLYEASLTTSLTTNEF